MVTIAKRDHVFAMLPELRWLRSFVAVAEEMHFSRAARKLNLAQPALTAHIHQLEDAVGSPLFQRSNRTAGLTAAGQALLPEARSILERAGALRGIARAVAKGEIGSLRIGIIPPAATPQLAETLRRFKAKFPGVEVSARQGNQDELLSSLLADDLDLVVGRSAAGEKRGNLCERVLFVEEQGVLLRADDPLAKLPRIPLRQLNGMRLLLLRDNPHFGHLLLQQAARHRVVLQPHHAAQDQPSLQWMVLAGQGIAPCSNLLADGLPRGLIVRKLQPAGAKLPISAIWRGPEIQPAAAALLASGTGFSRCR